MTAQEPPLGDNVAVQRETSSTAAAQQLVALCVVGARVATMVQMLPSLPTAIGRAERPILTAATWALAGSMTLVVVGLVLARRRAPSLGLAVGDIAVTVALFLAGLWTVPEEDRTGTWVGFQLAYSICVACSLMGVRRRSVALTLLLALTAAEVVYLAPTVHDLSDVPRVLGNLLTLLALGPLMWLAAGVVLRIGAEADEAKELAARMARAEEERRARLAIHNGTALLRLLVEETGGSDTHSRIRTQAEAELNRMRAYLTGTRPDTGEPDGPVDLADLVERVAGDFADLPLTVVADLARGVRLEPGLADDLRSALGSLLINVRQHARADRVVLHAEEPADGAGWVVTVHDDGVGFDTGTTAYGVGLRDLVVDQLAAAGVTTRVDSVPGVGTTVELTCRPDPAPTPDVSDHTTRSQP